MTKEGKIKEAWCEYYEINKEIIDENGWLRHCNKTDVNTLKFFKENKDIFDYRVCNTHNAFLVFHRPKSLQGIEHNNGWIKIESEEDLPKDFIICYIITIYSDNTIVEAYYSCGEQKFKPRDKYSTWSYSYNEITHYQPIEKPKLPIY